MTQVAPASAERLPLRVYTTADGLGHDFVKRIVRDSRGFLWFCTGDGLTRFDGQRFAPYGPAQGAPIPSVNDLLEARDGHYWVASNGAGVWRFDHTSPPGERFTAYPVGDEPSSQRVNTVFQDNEGRLWLGTDGGVFRLEPSNGGWEARPVPLDLPPLSDRLVQFSAFVEDLQGGIWAGSSAGLLRRLHDGRWIRYRFPASSRGQVQALLFDDHERLWVGHEDGLIIMRPGPPPSGSEDVPALASFQDAGRVRLPDVPGQALRYVDPGGLITGGPLSFHRSRDGRIWMGHQDGLAVFDGERFQAYNRRQGLSGDRILGLGEDDDGDLWMATAGSGALRLAPQGFVTYDEADGLADATVLSAFEDAKGRMYATGARPLIQLWNGTRFVAVRPNLPRSLDAPPVPTGIAPIEDHAGEWWVPTREGLYRFPRVARLSDLSSVSPRAVYTTRDGLATDDVQRVFEDSRGDVWIVSTGRRREPLTRWVRRTASFQRYSDAEGLPAFNHLMVLAEDRAGSVWVGFWEGGLFRSLGDRFAPITAADGLPPGPITALFVDDSGRLWVGTHRDGLFHIDDPGVDRPRLAPQATPAALRGTDISCMVNDRRGRLYVGGGTGLFRFDPASGRLAHYTMADGLARNGVRTAFRDRHGVLWFGTLHGLSRLMREDEAPRTAPPTFISGLLIDGIPRQVSDLGETDVSGLVLDPDQNRIQIDFLGLSFGPGRGVLYQYRLDGADRDWLAPTDIRSVNYAHLAPGRYRFRVRAVDADGRMSPTPASVAFSILPPVWRRWWFLTLAAAALASAGYGAHRLRLARRLAVERVRTRIATDLHDDIGSTVSRMALLSEVVKRQVEGTHAEAARILGQIGASARELVDSTSDIVWAVDPRRDDVASLVARVREFGAGLFEARSIAWEFDASAEVEAVRLDPEQRRQLYLILKEALHNIVRHAGGSRASVSIAVLDGRLRAEIRDDGHGFAALEESARRGHGLDSMRARAARLGGVLEVDSAPGAGTHLTLVVPLRRRDA